MISHLHLYPRRRRKRRTSSPREKNRLMGDGLYPVSWYHFADPLFKRAFTWWRLLVFRLAMILVLWTSSARLGKAAMAGSRGQLAAAMAGSRGPLAAALAALSAASLPGKPMCPGTQVTTTRLPRPLNCWRECNSPVSRRTLSHGS